MFCVCQQVTTRYSAGGILGLPLGRRQAFGETMSARGTVPALALGVCLHVGCIYYVHFLLSFCIHSVYSLFELLEILFV